MGLEYTEILMAVADEFGITIEDRAASQSIRTVGDLYAYVLGEIRRPGDSCRCITPGNFVAFRKALTQRLNLSKKDIQLDSELQDLVPREQRRRIWPKMTQATGLPLPYLRRRRSLVWLAVST